MKNFKNKSYKSCNQDRLLENWYFYGYYKPFREKYLKINTEDIECMVDELYENPDDFENIAKRYNIKMNYDEDYRGDLLVTHGSYDSNNGVINLYFSEKGIDAFEQGKKKGTMKSEILATYAHEYTHHQQNQKGSEKEKYKNYDSWAKESNSRWEAQTKYLSQTHEIDAFARGLAQEMSRNQVKISFLLKNIPDVDRNNFIEGDLDKYQTAFNKKLKKYNISFQALAYFMSYYLIGGKVWKRFLRRLYEFLPHKLQEKEVLF